MPNGIIDGAQNGAIVGAVTGGVIYLFVKVFKLDRYWNSSAGKPAIGESLGTPHPDGKYPPTPYLAGVAPATTHSGMIATMWVLTAILYLLTVRRNNLPPVATVLIDAPALVIAIILLCKRGPINKWNGGAKLGLEMIAFVVAFLGALHPPAGIFPVSAPGMPGMSGMPGMPGAPPNFAPQGHINAPPNFPMPPMPAMPGPPSLPR